MKAWPPLNATTYNRRFVRSLWSGRDACSLRSPNCREGETIIHELFHILGFVHDNDYGRLESGDGVAMSPILTRGDTVYRAAWPDIDLLRCIFPEGG